jgi:redox-sensing transcriptional repressor
MSYRGFNTKGFNLAAVFDNDPTKVGKKIGIYTIQPLTDLEQTIRTQSIKLAMITVPAEVAQDVANQLVAAGIRGVMNFAPVSLQLPPDVALNAVDLAVSLEQLSFQVNFQPVGPGI